MKPIDLRKVLRGIPPGTWVAISHNEREILGKGRTPDQALEAAKKKSRGERPILYKIPPPGVVIFAAT